MRIFHLALATAGALIQGDIVRTHTRRGLKLVSVSALGLTLAAGVAGGPIAAGTTEPVEPEATDVAAGGEAALAELVAAAEEEGSVTVYSSQGLDQLNALAEAFEAEYPGIDAQALDVCTKISYIIMINNTTRVDRRSVRQTSEGNTVRSHIRPGLRLASVSALSLALVAAVGGAAAATTEPAEPGATEASADADAALAELVAAAQEEGSVTIYSGQGLDQLNALAEAFEEEYDDIDVEVVRLNDADAIPRIETELSTGQSGGDLIVNTSLPFLTAHAEAGDFVDPTASPQLAGLGDYDAAAYVHEGNYFEVGAAVLTFAWNTDDVPEGLADYPDLLDESLAGGRIGVIDPAISPSVVDYYLFLEENFGEEFVADIAAQEPRIYPSALPIGEALTSGEISAALYAAPVQLVPAAADGAPVDFGISEAGAWGARYFGAIPTSADSPNAAALLADFMVRPLGQELVQGASGSVLPDIPGTLITNDQVRVMDLEAIAPEPAAAYVEAWNELFR